MGVFKKNKISLLEEAFHNMLPITIEHINQHFEKQNYTNLYLILLGEELASLKKNIDNILSVIHQIKPDVHINNKENKDIVSIASSSIQSPPEIQDFKFKSSVSEFEKILADKFKNMNISLIDENKSSSNNETPLIY